MTTTKTLLISALALFFAAQLNATPILVGEFDHKDAIRPVIDAYNASHGTDLSQLFSNDDTLQLINGWSVVVAQTSEVENYQGATDKFLSFTAPGTHTEYYVWSKYGKGRADFDSALHHLLPGDLLTYNPNGDNAPNGLGEVAIWGKTATGTNVPDSGVSIVLFGVSLMILGVIKRRMSS